MFYYRINGTLCCSLNGELDFPREELYGRGTDEKEAREKASGEEELVFLFERSPKNCRASFRVTDPALLYQDREDVSWLNKNALGEGMRDEIVDSFIKEGKMRAVNLNHPRFQEILKEKPEKKKKHWQRLINFIAISIRALRLSINFRIRNMRSNTQQNNA